METIINYYAGAPVPKYLNKIPENAELISLEYCNKMDDYYDVDYSFNYYIDYTFLNEYKNLKSLFLYNWGDYPPKDNLTYLLENNLLQFPQKIKVLCIYEFRDKVVNLNFLKNLKNLEFLIVNTVFTKENIDYLSNNIQYIEYKFNIEDVDNIIDSLGGKFKNLKKIFLENDYEKTEISEMKYNKLVKILKEKNIEIISNYDNFDIEDFIIDLFDSENQKVNVIDLIKDVE